MEKVIILLPTFNGEKYLQYQLDSLVNQTYKNIDVYIRDDNSKDNTIKIIDDYCSREWKGINFTKVDSNGENLGYPDCFWKLLKIVPEADYYCFCDQDDWWEPEKVERSIECLKKIDKNIPAMTYCEFDYYNQKMDYLRNGENILDSYDFEKGMYYTYAPGFTQMINRALVEKLNFDYIIGKNLAHDLWCQWIATSIGLIVPNDKVLARYRRHEMAVTSGNINRLSSIKRWWKSEICGDEMLKWKQSLCYFNNEYANLFNKNMTNIMDIFANKNLSLKNTFRKVFYPKRLRTSLGGEVALRILFLINKC